MLLAEYWASTYLLVNVSLLRQWVCVCGSGWVWCQGKCQWGHHLFWLTARNTSFSYLHIVNTYIHIQTDRKQAWKKKCTRHDTSNTTQIVPRLQAYTYFSLCNLCILISAKWSKRRPSRQNVNNHLFWASWRLCWCRLWVTIPASPAWEPALEQACLLAWLLGIHRWW